MLVVNLKVSRELPDLDFEANTPQLLVLNPSKFNLTQKCCK